MSLRRRPKYPCCPPPPSHGTEAAFSASSSFKLERVSYVGRPSIFVIVGVGKPSMIWSDVKTVDIVMGVGDLFVGFSIVVDVCVRS